MPVCDFSCTSGPCKCGKEAKDTWKYLPLLLKDGSTTMTGNDTMTQDQKRAEDAYNRMIADMGNAHRDVPAPMDTADADGTTIEVQFARDGTPLASLPAHEAAYERMVIDQQNAHRAAR